MRPSLDLTAYLRAFAALILAAAFVKAEDAPARPLDLDPPAEPDAEFELREFRADSVSVQRFDLAKEHPAYLRRVASSLAGREEYGKAIPFQHWAVKLDPDQGQLELARLYAADGKLDAACYWLQEAALKDRYAGVDSVEEERTFTRVRLDARWKKLKPFLEACSKYWVRASKGYTAVVVPNGYVPDRAIPVLLGLHGYGSVPDDFADPDCQRIADRERFAFVAVSATEAIGRKSFRWSEDIARDWARVNAGIAEAKNRVKIEPGKVIAIGYSQGAQLSVELAARQPGFFAGAIALCPGARDGSQLAAIAKADPRLARRMVLILGGTEEHPTNRQLAAADTAWLEKHGARVVHHEFPDMGHSFPPGYWDQLPLWTKLILPR